MGNTYNKLSYKEKRTYILATLETFVSYWDTFRNLHDRINIDTHYPVEKLDFIAEKIDQYKIATQKDKQQESIHKLHTILAQEQPTTEAELAKILSAL